MADAEREIIEILAKTCRFEPANVTAESRLDGLEVDSFDVIEAVFEIEEHFDITIPYDANRSGPEFETVGSIVGAVEKLIAEKETVT
jgi:acyl carrier protein